MDHGAPSPKATRTKTRRALKIVIILVSSIIGLTILLVAAGVAYVYFISQQPVPLATAPAAQKPQTNLPVPSSAPAEDAVVGVSVQTITSPVAPGENSSVAIQTLKTAKCTIVVEYDKQKATDSGLVEKTADEYGTTSWSWTVPANAPLGKWPVTITCVHGQKSAVVTTMLTVAAKTED